MAAPMFFFDANVSSPQELAKKRAVAQAMMMNFGKARNVGEGAGQLMQGIALGLQNRKWNQAEAAGKASAGNLFSSLFSGGQGAFPPAPPPPAGGGTVEPMDPATRRVSQAFGDPQTLAGGADPIQEVMDARGGGSDWLKYANQGATRNLPLDNKLVNAMGFLPELGVTMEVFSGGQPGKGEKGGRVGSVRHDHGGAADAFFYKDGRKLDWANPQDRPVFEEIVRRGKAAGITGFGAGDGYMQPGSMHLGFGTPAVWGAGGKGANAPDWLRNAFAGGGNPSPAMQAPPAVNGGAQVPMPSVAIGQPQQDQQQPPVQMAQAQGTLPEMAGNAPSVSRQQAGGPSVEVLMQAMSNPWLDDGQKQVIGAMLEQKLREQDPMRALEMQKAQIELQRLQNPGPEYDMITGRDGSIFRADKRTGNIEQVYGGKPDQPSGVQEYEYYANQERAAGREPAPFGEWKATQSRAGASQVNIDQKTEGAFDKKLAEGQAEIFNTMAQEGLNANADIAIIGQLDGLLGQNGGTLSGLSSMMAKYGIGGEGMSDIQAAQALINKLVPSQRQPGSGTMSDRDVELFTRSLPSLWNTPGGNKIILDTMRGLAEYKRKQGEIAMGVQMGELTRQEAVQALKALPNPLAGFGTNDRPQKKQPTVIDGYTIEEVE